MASKATEWLNCNRKYEEGLQILIESGASEFTVDLLSTGPDLYNTPHLLKLLQGIAGKEIINESIIALDDKVSEGKYLDDSREASDSILCAFGITPEIAGASAPAHAGLGTYSPDHNIEKKLRIDESIRQLWKEIVHLHGKINVLPEGDELHQVARAIKLKDLKRQDLWDQLHYYNTHGVWFDELPENKPKPANLEQEIKNLMAQRAKAKAFLNKPQPAAKKAFYEGKVAGLNKKIDELKTHRHV